MKEQFNINPYKENIMNTQIDSTVTESLGNIPSINTSQWETTFFVESKQKYPLVSDRAINKYKLSVTPTKLSDGKFIIKSTMSILNQSGTAEVKSIDINDKSINQSLYSVDSFLKSKLRRIKKKQLAILTTAQVKSLVRGFETV